MPNGWIVGATGAERAVARDEGDGTTTHHYYAEDVHDFAWTTSPDYVERIERFGHPACRRVDAAAAAARARAARPSATSHATRAALRYYGEWFGPYPTATSPSSIRRGRAARRAWSTRRSSPPARAGWRRAGVADPEDVTVHEAGHQFWYGVVASNEFEHAWMDEGLNTFATARALEQFFGPQYYAKRYFGGFVPWVFDDLPLSRATDGNYLAGYRNAADADAQSTPTWRYWPATAGVVTYNKTALWLNTLERMLGWDTLQRILSTYFARYAFKHPEPTDFFAVANEVSGRDLTWFFDQVYRSSNVFDYGVDVVHERAGVGPRLLRRRGQADVLGRTSARRTLYRTTLVVRRRATASSRSTCASCSRTARSSPLAVGRARALEAVRGRSARCAR